jgi:hypothetical protein
VRFLRKARELAYRDLGGLVFNLHRFGQRNDALVLAKLTTLDHIDTELRAIEDSLGERQPVTVLREAGITACPRCTAIHASEDNFCPNCGMPMNRRVDLPVGFQAAAGAPAAPSPVAPAPTPAAAQPSPSPVAPAPSAAPAQIPPSPNPAASPATPRSPQPSAAPSSERPAGRSPVPPGAGAPSQPSESPAEEDGETEIIRPRTSDS